MERRQKNSLTTGNATKEDSEEDQSCRFFLGIHWCKPWSSSEPIAHHPKTKEVP